MLNGRLIARALACLTAALFSLSAMAQVNPPPVRQAVDENGVDLIAMNLQTGSTNLSIGPSDGTGLSFKTYYSGDIYSGYNTHNLIGTIAGSSSNPIVTIGTSSESFTLSGGAYTADNPTGSSLQTVSGNYVYTTRDGTVAQFLSVPGRTFASYPVMAVVTSITKPNGLVTTWTYKADRDDYCAFYVFDYCQTPVTLFLLRIQSVNNNAGYQLKFTYLSNTATDPGWQAISRVTAINNAVEFCDTFYDCSLAQGWNYVQYTGSYVQSGHLHTTTYSWIDSANHGTIYTQTFDDSSTVATYSIRTNGRTVDDITYSGHYTMGPSGTFAPVESVNKAGQTWSYASSTDYSSNPVIRTVTDPLSHTRIYHFSSYGLLGSYTDELSNTTTYTYNNPTTIGSLHTITLPGADANVITYGYDGRYNVTSVTRSPKPSFGLSSSISTYASYPATCAAVATCNKATSTTDERNKTTSYQYDANTGALTQVVSPALSNGVHPTTNFHYDALYAWYMNGPNSMAQAPTPIKVLTSISSCQTNLGCENTYDERRTTIAYEDHSVVGKSNLLPVTKKEGDGSNLGFSTTTFSYDNVGNVVSVDGPVSGSDDVTRYYYNASRQQTGMVGGDPDQAGSLLPRAVRITYRPDGLVSQVDQGTVPTPTTDPASLSVLQTVAIDYDGYSRQRRQTLSAGGTAYAETDVNYDALGRPSCKAQRLNLTSSYADACTPSSGVNGSDRITHIDYMSDGKVWKQQSGYAVAARDSVTYGYTPTGKVQTLADARGNVTTYNYDAFDRGYKATFPDSSYEQSTLDDGGLATLLRLRDGNTIAATYDDLGNLVTKTPSIGNATYYGYNLLGARTYARFGSSSGSGVTYNPYGANFSQTINNLSGTDRMVQNYSDIPNVYRSVSFPGATSGAGLNYVSYVHDRIDRPTYSTLNDNTFLYTDNRDALGRPGTILRWVSGNWNNYTAYGYDGASRVASAASVFTSSSANLTYGYSYNAAGQITSQSRSNDAYAFGGYANANLGYSVNSLNQYTSAGGRSYSYDSRGNIIGYSMSGTTVETYGYDLENRLTSVSGAHNATLNYDPLGRLFSISSGGNTTQFEYDGSNLIAEYDGSGNVLRRYTFGENADRPMVWYEGAAYSSPRYLYADHQGSVVAVTDSSGNVTNINSYDEYGAPASGNVGRFQYTGQAWLAEIGMYYYKARMYSPQLGRFLQTDPIGYGDGMNMYNYADSDPLNRVDPSGMSDCPPGTPPGTLCTVYQSDPNNNLPPLTNCDTGVATCYSPPSWDTGVVSGVDWRMNVLPGCVPFNAPGWPTCDDYAKVEPIYITKIPCFRSGLIVRATGEAIEDVAGAGVAIGGTGVAIGVGLGITGGFTGNVPMAAVGAMIAAPSTLLTGVSALAQGAGAVLAFLGGDSSRDVIKNGAAAVVDRIPGLSAAAKFAFKDGAKIASHFIPDVRTCDRGY